MTQGISRGAKVVEAVLSAGNDRCNTSAKQFADIKHEKETTEEKLKTRWGQLKTRRRPLCVRICSE